MPLPLTQLGKGIRAPGVGRRGQGRWVRVTLLPLTHFGIFLSPCLSHA